jgi:vacuolar-type H+-ATPase subunit I/STV1
MRQIADGEASSGRKEILVKQAPTKMRVVVSYLLLFGVVLITAYLQSVFHFNTYLALAICLVDTIGCAMFVFG